jgi:hypothetical protein
VVGSARLGLAVPSLGLARATCVVAHVHGCAKIKQ